MVVVATHHPIRLVLALLLGESGTKRAAAHSTPECHGQRNAIPEVLAGMEARALVGQSNVCVLEALLNLNENVLIHSQNCRMSFPSSSQLPAWRLANTRMETEVKFNFSQHCCEMLGVWIYFVFYQVQRMLLKGAVKSFRNERNFS